MYTLNWTEKESEIGEEMKEDRRGDRRGQKDRRAEILDFSSFLIRLLQRMSSPWQEFSEFYNNTTSERKLVNKLVFLKKTQEMPSMF